MRGTVGAWIVMLFVAPAAARAIECSAPCIQAARGEYRECLTIAGTTRAAQKNTCLDRDLACVQACESRREDCDEATGLAPGFVACTDQLQAEVQRCRNDFAARATKREQCIDQARVSGFQCRNAVRRSAGPARKACTAEFEVCADGCGAADPPRDVRLCKSEVRRTYRAARADCNRAADLDASACANKDDTCVQTCRDARDTCAAPTQAALLAALAACKQTKDAAIGACQAASPDGGPVLDQCIDAADTDMFVCRTLARQDVAIPGFAACAQQYAGCVRACPAP